MTWKRLLDEWWDERRQPLPGDLHAAWDALWEVVPAGWTVGRPQYDPGNRQWTVSAVRVSGKPRGGMADVVPAAAPSEPTVLVELARCLVEVREGRGPAVPSDIAVRHGSGRCCLTSPPIGPDKREEEYRRMREAALTELSRDRARSRHPPSHDRARRVTPATKHRTGHAMRAQAAVLVVIVAACQGASQTPTAMSSATTVSASPTGTESARNETRSAPVPTATATSAPTRTAIDTPTPRAEAFGVGDIVEVIATDGLRVRSQPRIADDSIRLEPLLAAGQRLYVMDGPVSASGYEWYEVVPLPIDATQFGWVAAGSREGEPWLERGAAECPDGPPSVTAVRTGGIVCYGSAPVTFPARIVSCNCDIDGAAIEPSWFGYYSQLPGGPTGLGPLVLVEPGAPADANPLAIGLLAHFDPGGSYPDAVPVNERVHVTGQFDHPAARSCTSEDDGEVRAIDHAVLLCRTTFAVTAVEVER